MAVPLRKRGGKDLRKRGGGRAVPLRKKKFYFDGH